MKINEIQIERFTLEHSENLDDLWEHRKKIPDTILLEPLHGFYSILTAKSQFIIEPGNAILIPPNREISFIHHHGNKGYMAARWLHFTIKANYAYDLAADLKDATLLHGDSYKKSLEVFSHSHPLSLEEHKYIELASQFKATACILELIESLPASTKNKQILNRDPLLLSLLSFIANSKGVGLSIDIMAKKVHLSPSRFQAWFKDHMGTAPMSYVRSHKLQCLASDLLTQTSSIEELSHKYGFKTPFHLSNSFKKEYKMSPKDYRQKTYPSSI